MWQKILKYTIKCCCCLFPESCLTLLWPHGLEPARLLCPWGSPGKITGVSCHFLLQRIFSTWDGTHICCIGKQILYSWVTKEIPILLNTQTQIGVQRYGKRASWDKFMSFKSAVSQNGVVNHYTYPAIHGYTEMFCHYLRNKSKQVARR